MNPNKQLQRIPVIIISGFLGSGKTTLLNQLLSQLPKSAVIINEFGTTPIDQQLLREHQVPLSTLVGGCLCCQVIGALTPLLKNLRMAWEANPNAFERVIIETSGVANPEPVLDILLRERWLAARYSLEGVVTTVSAIMDEAHFDYFPEAKASCAFADTIVLTHTDMADPGQTANMSARIAAINPAAKRLTAIKGAVEPGVLFDFSKNFYRVLENKPADIPGHGFSTISVRIEQPMPLPRIISILSALTTNHSKELLRLKGLVYAIGHKQPFIVQGVSGQFFPPTSIPSRAIDDGVGRLVLISKGEVKLLAESLMSNLRCN